MSILAFDCQLSVRDTVVLYYWFCGGPLLSSLADLRSELAGLSRAGLFEFEVLAC